jgi:excisionase family DNA binding protein
MNATPTKRYLTNDEAAFYLGLGRQTLPKLRLRGTGPVYRKFGRSVRYALEDLDAWAKNHCRRSTSEGSAALRRDRARKPLQTDNPVVT